MAYETDIKVNIKPHLSVNNDSDPLGSGFVTYVAKPSATLEEAQKKGYLIAGYDMQVVTKKLDPGESIMTNPGSMMFASPSIEQGCECTNAWTRCCAGESCCMTHYKNEGNKTGYIGLTPSIPAKIIPFEMNHVRGNEMIVKPGLYFMSEGDVNVGYSFECCSTSVWCCTGLGRCRQNITGTGTAMVAASGTIITKDLAAGETIIVDADSLVGFESSVKDGAKPTGACCMYACGGEGCCYSTLTGPGRVYLQSTSFKKMKNEFTPPPSSNPPGSQSMDGDRS